MHVTLAQLDIAWAQVLSATLSPFSGQGPGLGLELHKVVSSLIVVIELCGVNWGTWGTLRLCLVSTCEGWVWD